MRRGRIARLCQPRREKIIYKTLPKMKTLSSAFFVLGKECLVGDFERRESSLVEVWLEFGGVQRREYKKALVGT